MTADATPIADLRDAASVILARERPGGLEYFLLRRHKKAGFMANSFVFPGGIDDARDHGDLRLTAARELFEEAGVLLSDASLDAETRDAWRVAVDRDGRDLAALVAEMGAAIDTEALLPYAHWITPSIEKRRYSAHFFVARMPASQTATADDRETTDQVWLTARAAIERKAELKLPPPQVRTFLELAEAGPESWDALVSLCREREKHIAPILPRMATIDGRFALLLPWDPDYQRIGQGDALAIDAANPLAAGPSRFFLTGDGWDHESP